MSSDKVPQFLRSPRLPTDQDLKRLSDAIERAGRKKGFSGRRIDRYRAWILVFLSWRVTGRSSQTGPDEIGAFWDALRRHPHAGGRELAEAMDALGFLFGTLGSPESFFSYGEGPASHVTTSETSLSKQAPKKETAPGEFLSEEGPVPGGRGQDAYGLLELLRRSDEGLEGVG